MPRHTMHLHPEETGFLDALARDPGDESLRAVYADWLEERGDRRAEWLRLEASLFAALRSSSAVPDGEGEEGSSSGSESLSEWPNPSERPGVELLRERVEELREALSRLSSIDPAWAGTVTRMPIENCDVWSRLVRLRFRCPERWEALDPTFSPGVRFCGACRRHVFYCSDLETAVTHARAGNCVAVAPQVPRKPGDLDAVEMLLGEMEETAAWPEGLDRETVRPFAHFFRALQRMVAGGVSPFELDESEDDVPARRDGLAD